MLKHVFLVKDATTQPPLINTDPPIFILPRIPVKFLDKNSVDMLIIDQGFCKVPTHSNEDLYWEKLVVKTKDTNKPKLVIAI